MDYCNRMFMLPVPKFLAFLLGPPSRLSAYVGVPKHHLDDDATRDDATRGDVLASRRVTYRCRHVVIS